MVERVRIARRARQLKTGKIEPELNNPNAPVFASSTPVETRRSFKRETKEERFALLAVLVNDVLSHALARRAERKPFGLIKGRGWKNPEESIITEIPRDDPFEYVRTAMNITLEQALRERLDHWEELYTPEELIPEETQLKKIYQRAVQLSVFAEVTGLSSVEHRILLGIHTGTETIGGFIAILPEIYRQQTGSSPTAEILINNARSSFSFIMEHATMHGGRFNTAMDVFEIMDFDRRKFIPEMFCLTEVNGQYRTGLTPEAKKQIDEKFDRYTIDSPTIGCVAAVVNFGEGTVLERFWDWYLDIAQTIYERDFPKKT